MTPLTYLASLEYGATCWARVARARQKVSPSTRHLHTCHTTVLDGFSPTRLSCNPASHTASCGFEPRSSQTKENIQFILVITQHGVSYYSDRENIGFLSILMIELSEISGHGVGCAISRRSSPVKPPWTHVIRWQFHMFLGHKTTQKQSVNPQVVKYGISLRINFHRIG